jgi:adenosylcobinamide-GDP ribazoletransferase
VKDILNEKNGTNTNAGVNCLIESLIFLTRLPVKRRTQEVPELSAAMAMFPVAGLIIGALAGIACAIAMYLSIPNLVAATLAIIALVAVTGALHEDGISDVADGFGGGDTKERKLEIMHDSRCGAFGVTALVLILGIKVASLSAILGALSNPWLIIPLFAAITAWPRALAVSLMATTANARGTGLAENLGTPTAQAQRKALVIGGFSAAVLIWLGLGWLACLAAFAISLAVFWLVRSLALRQIGGHTGDVAGTVIGVGEAAMLTALSAFV